MTAGHVFLVGFMGAGKSTVGRRLASALHRPFVDLDLRIEREHGRSISEIFSLEGEEAFRLFERDALVDMEGEPTSIVACGGGLVMRDENRLLLGRLGTVVYLKVTAGEAIARVGDTKTRPLLSGGSGSTAVTSLLAAREGLYASIADITVDTSGRSPAEVVRITAAALADHGVVA